MKCREAMILWFAIAALLAAPIAAQSNSKTNDNANKDSQSASTDRGDEFAPSRVLAIVGGEPIFVGDMLFEVNQLITRFMPDAPQKIVERERKLLLTKILPKYIEQKMLLIDVKSGLPPEADFEEFVKNASSEFDDKALEGLMKSAGVASPIVFDAHLRAQGSSLRKLRRTWTISQVVRFFLTEKIKSDAEVSHQELLEYYREHAEDYEIKAKAKWQQVMVRHDRFPSSSDGMKAIIELGNKIVYGASMDGVAKKSSHGYRASTGGQHDWTSQGALVLKEIDSAIFSLPIGELSDIIKTRDGYHIVRVLERQEAGKVEFVDAQIEIKKKLEADKRVAAYDAHLAKLKETIPVEIMGESDKSPLVTANNAEPSRGKLR